MKTKIVLQNDPQALKMAISILQAGGLVVFPTDTVYGLGGLVNNENVITRIYQAKERSPSKAIAVLVGEVDQLSLIASQITPAAQKLADRFWPGALTLVVPVHPDLPANLSPFPTIGIRLPDHPFARELLRCIGPLATTSANLSGGPNPRNLQEVLAQLDGRVELVIDGGEVTGGVPSTVVDCTGDCAVILRHGAIDDEAIQAALTQS